MSGGISSLATMPCSRPTASNTSRHIGPLLSIPRSPIRVLATCNPRCEYMFRYTYHDGASRCSCVAPSKRLSQLDKKSLYSQKLDILCAHSGPGHLFQPDLLILICKCLLGGRRPPGHEADHAPACPGGSLPRIHTKAIHALHQLNLTRNAVKSAQKPTILTAASVPQTS
jgi:hypothetical protein